MLRFGRRIGLAFTEGGLVQGVAAVAAPNLSPSGRVAVGHATQMSLLPPDRFRAIAATLANAGVAVTILPSTDLHLMGRSHDHAIPRGVVAAGPLREAGVTCSISTNNVLNPFTPYGDGSLIRMANLYANVCHVSRSSDLVGCLDMITDAAARLMRLDDYGIKVGGSADLGPSCKTRLTFECAGDFSADAEPDTHMGARLCPRRGIFYQDRLRQAHPESARCQQR